MRPTTDPSLRSFIDVPPESPFPVQNLPYGVFRPEPGAPPRVGVAIGEWVLDLSVLEERGLFGGPELAGKRVFAQPTLNGFAALGPAAWHEAREQISRLLRHDVAVLRDDLALRDQALVALDAVEMCLPLAIGDYTEFAASPEVALEWGASAGGDREPLRRGRAEFARLVPVGRAGRVSSIVVSGTAITRPRGVTLLSDQGAPICAPTKALDCELHLGIVIGRGNELGRPIPISRAPNQVFGYVLLAVWRARDFQELENQVGVAFASRNFASTISPWIVSPAALEPFRCAGPPQDPALPAYLRIKDPQAFDIHIEIALRATDAEAPQTISTTNSRHLYWSPVQLIAQHTLGGCNLRPGDVIGVGPLSGPLRTAAASLHALTCGGREPLRLPDGRERTYLEDGDTLIFRGWSDAGHYRVGFGECRGTVVAPPLI